MFTKRRGLALFLLSWPVLLAATLPIPAGKNGSGLDISGGITLNGGNSNQTVINGGYCFGYRLNSFSFQSKLELFYGQSNQITEVNNGTWKHDVLHSLNKRLNLSGSLGFEYDRIAGIALRYSLDLGILYMLVQSDKNKIDLTATIRGEYLYGSGGTENRKSARITMGILNELTFSETAHFKLSFQLMPNISAPIKDYRFELQTSLSILMKRPLWLTVKLRERYTHLPQDLLIKKNDLTLVTALTLSF